MDSRDAVIFTDATASFLNLWIANGKDARTFEDPVVRAPCQLSLLNITFGGHGPSRGLLSCVKVVCWRFPHAIVYS